MKAIGRFFLYMGRDLLKYLGKWGASIGFVLLLCTGIGLVMYGLGWVAHIFIEPVTIVTFESIFTPGAALFCLLCIVSGVVFLIFNAVIPIVKWIISLIKRARHG